MRHHFTTAITVGLLGLAASTAPASAQTFLSSQNRAAVSFGEPLVDAADKGEAIIVKGLLDNGSAVSGHGKFGATALHRAAAHGNLEIGEMLLNAGGATALHLASREGNAAFTELLLNSKANPNAKDAEGWTPLMRAANTGNVEIARLLLDHGAELNIGNASGDTALMEAAKRKHPDVTKLLVDRGADDARKNRGGDTAHTLSQQKGGPDINDLIAGRDAEQQKRMEQAQLRLRAINEAAAARQDVERQKTQELAALVGRTEESAPSSSTPAPTTAQPALREPQQPAPVTMQDTPHLSPQDVETLKMKAIAAAESAAATAAAAPYAPRATRPEIHAPEIQAASGIAPVLKPATLKPASIKSEIPGKKEALIAQAEAAARSAAERLNTEQAIEHKVAEAARAPLNKPGSLAKPQAQQQRTAAPAPAIIPVSPAPAMPTPPNKPASVHAPFPAKTAVSAQAATSGAEDMHQEDAHREDAHRAEILAEAEAAAHRQLALQKMNDTLASRSENTEQPDAPAESSESTSSPEEPAPSPEEPAQSPEPVQWPEPIQSPESLEQNELPQITPVIPAPEQKLPELKPDARLPLTKPKHAPKPEPKPDMLPPRSKPEQEPEARPESPDKADKTQDAELTAKLATAAEAASLQAEEDRARLEAVVRARAEIDRIREERKTLGIAAIQTQDTPSPQAPLPQPEKPQASHPSGKPAANLESARKSAEEATARVEALQQQMTEQQDKIDTLQATASQEGALRSGRRIPSENREKVGTVSSQGNTAADSKKEALAAAELEQQKLVTTLREAMDKENAALSRAAALEAAVQAGALEEMGEIKETEDAAPPVSAASAPEQKAQKENPPVQSLPWQDPASATSAPVSLVKNAPSKEGSALLSKPKTLEKGASVEPHPDTVQKNETTAGIQQQDVDAVLRDTLDTLPKKPEAAKTTPERKQPIKSVAEKPAQGEMFPEAMLRQQRIHDAEIKAKDAARKLEEAHMAAATVLPTQEPASPLGKADAVEENDLPSPASPAAPIQMHPVEEPSEPAATEKDRRVQQKVEEILSSIDATQKDASAPEAEAQVQVAQAVSIPADAAEKLDSIGEKFALADPDEKPSSVADAHAGHYWIQIGDFDGESQALGHFQKVITLYNLHNLNSKALPSPTSKRKILLQVGPLNSAEDVADMCLKFRVDGLGCATVTRAE